MTLSVFATIRPKPEHLPAAIAAIQGIMSSTRAEPGCIQFSLHEGDGTGLLHLYEVWSDRDAFDAHHAQAYTRAIYEQYQAWLAAPVELTFMHPLESATGMAAG